MQHNGVNSISESAADRRRSGAGSFCRAGRETTQEEIDAYLAAIAPEKALQTLTNPTLLSNLFTFFLGYLCNLLKYLTFNYRHTSCIDVPHEDDSRRKTDPPLPFDRRPVLVRRSGQPQRRAEWSLSTCRRDAELE